MNIEKQVCTLVQAKKLKELGIVQESTFYVVEYIHNSERSGEIVYRSIVPYPTPNNHYSAFTVAELGVMLGTGALQIHPSVDCVNEAQDRADDLIHLIEMDELSALLCSDRLEA